MGWMPGRDKIGGMKRAKGPWSHNKDLDPTDTPIKGDKPKRKKREGDAGDRFVTHPEDIEIIRNGKKIKGN